MHQRNRILRGRLQHGLWSACAAAAVLFSLDGAAETTSLPGSDDHSTAIALVRDHVVLRTWLNGVGPYAFLLDTGATAPIIDTSIAQTLSSATAPPGPPGGRSGLTLPACRFADAELRDLRFLTADLSPFTRTLGISIAGVVPGGVAGRNLCLDVSTGQVQFLSTPPEFPAVAGVVPLKSTKAGTPCVTLLLNDMSIPEVGVDTSFGGMIALPEDMAAALKLLTTATPRLELESALSPGTEPRGLVQVRLKRLSLGEVDVRAPVCAILKPGDEPCVGIEFLRVCRLWLSPLTGQARFEPRVAMPYTAPPIFGYGLAPATWRDGRWTVAVAKDSPADRAGTLGGDLIVRIDDEDMLNTSYEAVRQGLTATTTGDQVELTLERDRKRFTVTLVSVRLL